MENERLIAVVNFYSVDDLKDYLEAPHMRAALYNLKDEIRKKLKYSHEFKTADEAL